ncbi:unnamed protein product, partial [Polarella glacialis]
SRCSQAAVFLGSLGETGCPWQVTCLASITLAVLGGLGCTHLLLAVSRNEVQHLITRYERERRQVQEQAESVRRILKVVLKVSYGAMLLLAVISVAVLSDIGLPESQPDGANLLCQVGFGMQSVDIGGCFLALCVWLVGRFWGVEQISSFFEEASLQRSEVMLSGELKAALGLEEEEEEEEEEANSMWGQTNQQQQASALAKNVEVNQLASADLEHRRKAQEEAKLGRQRLDEMRHVRDKVHAKLRAAKAAGSHETGVASCALARAGQRAMSARGEAQLWDKQAKSTENRAIVAAVREQEALNMVEKGSDIRVAAAKEHLEGRRAKSEQLTSLAQEQGEVSQRQHSEHLEMKERHAAGHGQLKVGAASRAQELAKQEMYTVSAKSGKQQMSV